VKVLLRLRGRVHRVFVPALVWLLLIPSCAHAQDVTVVGTPEQANERIKALGQAQASKSPPREYTIGSGDVLSILVFDVPELTRQVSVSQSGTISIPLVPARLHMAGLTEIQAQQAIADVLEANGLVSHPQVEVTVKEHRSRPITIVGAVGHPMVYEADRDVTLLEVLAGAGGIANDAGDTVIITRQRSALFIPIANPELVSGSAPGAASSASEVNPAPTTPDDKEQPPSAAVPAFPSPPQSPQTPQSGAVDSSGQTQTPAPLANTISINLNELIEKGDIQNNIPLQAGDVVTVPHAGIVYVLGAVNRPGGFVLANDRTPMTTLKILTLAGGQTRFAKLDHAVIVRRDSQGKQMETEVDLKKIIGFQAEDVQMRASDILYVPNNTTKAAVYQALATAIGFGMAIAIYRVGSI
jgi:polysaccharide export outer membrane protein